MERAHVLVDGREAIICGYGEEHYFKHIQAATAGMDQTIFSSIIKRFNPESVFDIGANIGVTMTTAAKIRPEAKIVAVEPSPRAFKALQATAAANELDVSLVNACVGESAGMTNFVEEHFLAGSHRGEGGVPVRMVTLEGLVKSYGAPDVIKIDVEGFEAHVLRGCGPRIAQAEPVFMMEFNAFTLNAFGGTSAMHLLEQISRMATGVFYQVGDSFRWAQSNRNFVDLIHTVMIERGCVADIIFTTSAAKRALISEMSLRPQSGIAAA